MRRFINRVFGATPRADQSSPAPQPAVPAVKDEYWHLPDGRSVKISTLARLLDERLMNSCSESLREAHRALEVADPDEGPLPLLKAESAVRGVEAVAPDHPMLDWARAAIAVHAPRFTPRPLPPLHAIGQLGDECPTCRAALAKRPQRKATCPHCGTFIFCRTRPLDGAQVLLKESELAALEEDWATDYKMKQRQPRQIDPVWAERIAAARLTGPHADATVEAAAQRIFAALQIASPTEAPRDAKDRLLRKITDPTFRDWVDRRVWQLQVQATSPKGN
jgi:hypothetical protein